VTGLAKADSPDCSACGDVSVSPGANDLKLGADFPTFSSVKLSYPNSTILANSTGDLLFSVSLTSNSTNTVNGVSNATLYRAVDIYVPPDFTGLTTSRLWSSFTNNYDSNSIRLSRQSSTDQIGPSWWRITISNVIVTSDESQFETNSSLVSQRIFLANQTQYIRLFQITSPVLAGRYFFKVFINGTSVGSANFPTLVVKASRDPAYISGTLRDAGNIDPTVYGEPITLSEGSGGKIVATGKDSLGRSVAATAYINSTALGQYTLFGVAPGTYNITAYAAGFIPTTKPTTVTVHAAQSLEKVDIYLPHSVNVTGTVLSLDNTGNPVPWGSLFGLGGTASRSIVIYVLNLDGSTAAVTPAPFRPSLFTDPDASSFDFAIQNQVGFDGRIPQDFANYTSGLSGGDYLMRAFVTSYVQFDDTYLHVDNQTNQASAIIRLIRTGYFVVTVHFRDFNSSLTDTPLSLDSTLTVQAIDSDGIVRGSNVTSVGAGSTSATLEIQGFSESRGFGIVGLFSQDSGLRPGSYHILAKLSSSPTFAGFANVGIRTLYYQTVDVQGYVGVSNEASVISFAIYRGGGILLTLYSVDTETPPVIMPWAHPGASVTFKVMDSIGNVYQTNGTQPAASGQFSFFYAGLLTDKYLIQVKTVGYTQPEVLEVRVVLGGNSDANIWMIQDPTIELTLNFETENIFTAIDSTQPFAQPINNIDATPLRVEVYDMNGNFAGANATYIPNLSTDATIMLSGFERYSGDPWQIWSGFYDTTDGARQDDGGFAPGTYQIRVWVDGYYQRGLIQVTLQQRQTASVIATLDRASRISGTVVGPDIYQEARPISWAIIDLEPGNATTSSLDGSYQLWAPSGSYGIGVSNPGYQTYATPIYLAQGSDLTLNVYLTDFPGTQDPVNVPEFQVGEAIILLVALGTTLAVNRNRKSASKKPRLE
jgi:hypothetical protein